MIVLPDSWVYALPDDLPEGDYYVALAILDPAGMLPCVRFATVNYFAGGRHPVGIVGVGTESETWQMEEAVFDDPGTDDTLHYVSQVAS